MSHNLLVFDIPLTEKVIRTVAVYLFLLIGLRLAGKRELGQLNPFDLVVLLLLSNTLQNAIIGNDNSLLGGVAGAATLLALNWLVVRFLYTHPVAARWFEGDSDVLVKNGEVQVERLKRELITAAELEAAARRQGLDGLEHVESCRLEIGGAITFVPKKPTDDENRHRAVMERLNAIAEVQETLTRQLNELRGLAPMRTEP